MLLEVFTDSQDESKALQMALSLRNDLKKTVKDAVKAGKIAGSRYDNYRLIYDELKNKRRY